MNTRPLELEARLSPPPRSLDAVHFVNVGLVALFFAVFGSRFVLAPGLGITLPRMQDAVAQASVATVVINVPAIDTVIVDNAILRSGRLEAWLRERAATERNAVLLIRANQSVPLSELVRLSDLALGAGFNSVQVAAEASKPSVLAAPSVPAARP